MLFVCLSPRSRLPWVRPACRDNAEGRDTALQGTMGKGDNHPNVCDDAPYSILPANRIKSREKNKGKPTIATVSHVEREKSWRRRKRRFTSHKVLRQLIYVTAWVPSHQPRRRMAHLGIWGVSLTCTRLPYCNPELDLLLDLFPDGDHVQRCIHANIRHLIGINPPISSK